MVSKVVNDGVINWNKLYISGGVRGVIRHKKKYYDGHHSVDYNVCERWYKFIQEKVVCDQFSAIFTCIQQKFFLQNISVVMDGLKEN